MTRLLELWLRFYHWWLDACEPDEYYENADEEDWWRLQW